MRPAVKRALQLGAILGIVVLGGLTAMQSTDNPMAEAYIFGLIAVGVIGVGLSEIGDADVIPASAMSAAAARQRDQMLDNALGYVAKIIQAHLEENTRYSTSLAHANMDLPSLERPEQIRAVILMLIEANQSVQGKIGDLSRNLEDSRNQIVKLRSNLAEANEIGMRDPLTALGNRRSFDVNLAREVAEARADDGDMCLAIADLDKFKRINDKFGHPVGDMVLKLFGELLSHNTKGRDTVARFGGEEFAIIFPRTRLADAGTIADQIRRHLEAKQWVIGASGERIGSVTASFGVARLRSGEGPDDLVRRADAKLYEAKSAGGNRVAVDRDFKNAAAA